MIAGWVTLRSLLTYRVHGIAQGLHLVVDNTFAPMILSPARLGADVVVQSLTKFVSGSSDIIAGKPELPFPTISLLTAHDRRVRHVLQ